LATIRPLGSDKIASSATGADVPPLILGWQSTVLAEAVRCLTSAWFAAAAGWPMRCGPRLNAANLPYDYDTFVFYVAHLYNGVATMNWAPTSYYGISTHC
jgi:hypothetical protein